MAFSNSSGMYISDDVKKLIEKAIKREKRQIYLAEKMGITNAALVNYRGKDENKRKSYIITWEAWAKMREYFIKHGDISPDDPRYMTPAEMLNRLLADLNEHGKVPPLSENLAQNEDELELLRCFRKLPVEAREKVLAATKNGADFSGNVVAVANSGGAVAVVGDIKVENKSEERIWLKLISEIAASEKICPTCRAEVVKKLIQKQ